MERKTFVIASTSYRIFCLLMMCCVIPCTFQYYILQDCRKQIINVKYILKCRIEQHFYSLHGVPPCKIADKRL